MTALSVVGRVAARPYIHTPLVCALIYLLILVMGVNSYQAYLVNLVLIYAVAALGLNVPVGMLGQLNLGQGAAFGLGAYTAAILIGRGHWPILPALVAAMIAGGAAGFLMGAPAARIGTIGLAITTLGYTIVFTDLVIALPQVTGGAEGIPGVKGSLLGGDPLTSADIGLLIVIVAGLTYLAHYYIRTRSLGRQFLAIKDEAQGAAALGINRTRVRILGVVIGCGVGSLAGGLYSVNAGSISVSDFTVTVSITLLIMVIFGGSATRWGPLLGAIVIGIFPILFADLQGISRYLYGAILLLVVRFLPRGVIRRTGVAVGSRLRAGYRALVAAPDDRDAGDERSVATLGRRVLTGTGLEIAFGGNRALKGVDITLDSGEVLAIVGPNGSGKTTLLNVLSGYYRLRSGRVEFLGRAVRPAPSALAVGGLARTFQVPKVFDDLTVGEHVTLAIEGRRHHPDVASRELGWALLEEMSLVDAPWDTEVRKLAHGQRRFLEIAMAFLREPHAILLDEPAAGMAVHEMEALANHLRRYAAMGGGVVLVEHHLDWLTSLASTVAVMHEGLLIWRGVPDDLRDAAIVQDAFLGRGRADG